MIFQSVVILFLLAALGSWIWLMIALSRRSVLLGVGVGVGIIGLICLMAYVLGSVYGFATI